MTDFIAYSRRVETWIYILDFVIKIKKTLKHEKCEDKNVNQNNLVRHEKNINIAI